MQAGDFDKRIAIQGSDTLKDDDGYPIEGSVHILFKLWAIVKPISAKEYLQAKADQTESITRFVIRYRKNLIDDTMKIIYRERTYDIISIINDYEDDKTLTLIGREVV